MATTSTNATDIVPGASYAIQQLTAQPAAVLATVAGLIILLNLLLTSLSRKSITPRLSGLPFRNAWLFFTKRYDFLARGFDKIGGNAYKFNFREHNIIVIRGENARKGFFDNKDFSFNDGYIILQGSAPRVEELKVDFDKEKNDKSWFSRRITYLLRKERLDKLIPELFDDLERQMNMWPQSGTMNPFENVYNLVFQLTARAATSPEIADHPEKVSRLGELFWLIEHGANPRAMVFPFLPNAGVKRKNAALQELYTMISGVVDKRKVNGAEEPESCEDAIQVLIKTGDATPAIVQFVMATLFAGVVNTGITSCWILLFLAANDVWRNKAIAEVNEFIQTYAPSADEGLSPAQRLAKVPIEAWEDGLPVMELIIRETIRIAVSNPALRRNVEQDMHLDGVKIERGDFLVYPFPDVHFNPEIYTNPMEFDPSRFEKGREEDKKSTHAYIGWGVGRHPCLGMRFAKLEIKCICALFLSIYEYQHIDVKGNPMRAQASDVDRNDIFQARPKGAPPLLKYKRMQ